MKHKQIAFGVVGLLIGFVLGFFTDRAITEYNAPPAASGSVASQSTGALPEGHPPVDTLAQIQEMEKHAQEHPEHTDVKIRLGDAYYDMGRFDAAIPWYEQALQQEPGNINVLNDLATCYFSTGNTKKSVELLNKSLELEKDHPVALQNLGWFYFSSQDYPAAIEAWERLVAAHPNFQNVQAIKEHLEKARAHLRGDHS